MYFQNKNFAPPFFSKTIFFENSHVSEGALRISLRVIDNVLTFSESGNTTRTKHDEEREPSGTHTYALLRSQSYPSYTRVSLKRFYSVPFPTLSLSLSLVRLSPAITRTLQLIVSERCRTLFEISSYVSFGIIRDNLNLRHLPHEFTSMPIDCFR